MPKGIKGSTPLCSTGDGELAKSNGLCGGHYARWRKTGVIGGPIRKGRGVCSVKTCGEFAKGHGWCPGHYERVRKHGDPLADVPLRRWQRNPEECTVATCSEPARKRGWCYSHYSAWRKYGDPTTQVYARPGEAGYLTSEGYRYVRTPDGRLMREHRWVMEQQLGRPLLSAENVHHRNGDKVDNRPENLELWITHQPKGQRVDDLLSFVVERYPEQLTRMLRQQRRSTGPTEHPPTLW